MNCDLSPWSPYASQANKRALVQDFHRFRGIQALKALQNPSMLRQRTDHHLQQQAVLKNMKKTIRKDTGTRSVRTLHTYGSQTQTKGAVFMKFPTKSLRRSVKSEERLQLLQQRLNSEAALPQLLLSEALLKTTDKPTHRRAAVSTLRQAKLAAVAVASKPPLPRTVSSALKSLLINEMRDQGSVAH